MIKLADKWKDYTILGTGGGSKLEDWDGVVLLRPDPQVIWGDVTPLMHHKGLNAVYYRDSTGGGLWDIKKPFKDEWTIKYNLAGKTMMSIVVKPMGFKHTGVFPEQAINWDTMYGLIKGRLSKSGSDSLKASDKQTSTDSSKVSDNQAGKDKSIRINKQSSLDSSNSFDRPNILNLFGYTGVASVACAMAGAKVTHVDAAKNMVGICKQNAQANGISDIRYIVDDCNKFVEREINRGNKYDGILMDPPSYGRGPNNEPWKLTEHICDFVKNAAKLLSSDPLFVLLNSYTTGLQPSVLLNILNMNLPKGKSEAYELAIPTKQKGIILPCGCSGLWTPEAIK